MLDIIKNFHLNKFGPKGAILDQEMYILSYFLNLFSRLFQIFFHEYGGPLFSGKDCIFFFNSAQIQGKIGKIQPKISFFSITRFHVFFHKIKKRRLLDSHILIFFYRKFPI